jgi:DNA-binding CsgD family transcriptional regulator
MAFALVGLGRIDLHQGRRAEALRSYQEALRLWAGIGERWASMRALVGLAAIAAVEDQPDLAATLLGVIDQRIVETGGGVFPVDHGHHERATAEARVALGEERYAALRAEGRALTAAEVVERAMTITVSRPRRSTRGALSRREREVLRLIVEGRSNAEIAAALYIGVRTARTHVESILTKLDVSTRTAAATYAVRHNLV